MDVRNRPFNRQTGYMLLEVLISILLLSGGILGAIGMQAVSVRHNSNAKYRVDASFLANALIARMWTDDRRPDELQTKYGGGTGGTDGEAYTTWLEDDVQVTLPGVEAYPPRVEFPQPPGTVTITVSWQVPGEKEVVQQGEVQDVVHRYVASTRIK